MRASAKAAGGEMNVPFPGYGRGCVGVVCAVVVRALAFYALIKDTVLTTALTSLDFQKKEAPY